MPTYNFKKQTKVSIVKNNLRYYIDVYPDITCSQTFDETSVPVKTLHTQYNMFADASIVKASPANFSFTIPLIKESDLDIILELLLDYDATNTEVSLKTADLYIEANSEVYKISNVVFESGIFQITKNALITISVSGTGSKLSKFVGTIPGTVQTRSSTSTYNPITSMLVAVNGNTQNYISTVTFELKNDVHWLDFATLQNSLNVNDTTGTMFPVAFVVGGRTLSGTIQQYVTDETALSVTTWSTTAQLSVQINRIGASWELQFIIPEIVFTNRLDIQDMYMQSYDFRMTYNTPNLRTIIKKYNF